jgi:hypothetical protein
MLIPRPLLLTVLLAAVVAAPIVGIPLVGSVAKSDDAKKPEAQKPDAAKPAAKEAAKPAAEEAKKPEADPLATARRLLAIPPRPARQALPPSRLPLEFQDGERIAFVGNSTAERLDMFGTFETLLHQRFPGKRLVVRNFARPADEVTKRDRGGDYTKLDDPIAAFGADTYLLFFGFNESFAGSAAAEQLAAQ